MGDLKYSLTQQKELVQGLSWWYSFKYSVELLASFKLWCKKGGWVTRGIIHRRMTTTRKPVYTQKRKLICLDWWADIDFWKGLLFERWINLQVFSDIYAHFKVVIFIMPLSQGIGKISVISRYFKISPSLSELILRGKDSIYSCTTWAAWENNSRDK